MKKNSSSIIWIGPAGLVLELGHRLIWPPRWLSFTTEFGGEFNSCLCTKRTAIIKLHSDLPFSVGNFCQRCYVEFRTKTLIKCCDEAAGRFWLLDLLDDVCMSIVIAG